MVGGFLLPILNLKTTQKVTQMSTPLSSIKTVILPIDAVSPQKIEVPLGFRQNTITAQPLNIQGTVEGKSISELVTEANNVLPEDVTGTVVFKAIPPRTFYAYDIPDATVDLSAPSFVSTDIPVGTLVVELGTITGATHIAITMTNYL